MNPNARYLLVGSFVLLSIIISVALILLLAGTSVGDAQKRYAVQINSDVNGLLQGSMVRYLGVDVGRVAGISLRQDTAVAPGPYVEVLVDLPQDIPIQSHTFATLVTQGVTGVAVIDLGTDPKMNTPIANNADGIPVIPYRRTGLFALLAESGDIASSASQLLEQLSSLVSADAQQALSNILTDTEQVLAMLSANREEIPAILQQTNQAVADLDRLLKTLQQNIDGELPPILESLNTTVASAASATQRLDNLLLEHEDTINRMMTEGVDQLPGLIDELRQTARSLEALAREVGDNPSRVMFQPQQDAIVVQP